MSGKQIRDASLQIGVALALCAALPVQACWDDAASRYQVSSALLYAMARTESGLNPQAVGRNKNGSRDIGLMQINSRSEEHTSELQSH